jgi:hypothetical protein
MTPVQAVPYTSPIYTFSIENVQGDFSGNTFGGMAGIPADRTILCGAPGSTVNCTGITPITDTKLVGQPITLYPIDSEFGYQVIDFLGAAQKTRDNDYAEGFVGNVTTGFPTQAVIDGVTFQFNNATSTSIYDAPITGGIAVSNAATDTYKVKPPMGTWCVGLGGNSVKCETEHYSVMEHILTCHELIPYFYADPTSGTQAVLNPGSVDIPTLGEFDCADAGLDDLALIMINGELGGPTGTVQLIDGTPCDAVNDPPGCQMFPNDKTSTLDNVALTTDYSVQLKDDGKALYGWGTIHKRPNDVRLYASLPLPAEWKVPGNKFVVNSAKLIVRHHITNNPNDQLRPEDLENEAATGRKPSYRVENAGTNTETWKATKACFEGDSDLIDTEDGNLDPTFLDVGTVFKNTYFAITTSPPTSTVPTNDTDLPYPLSGDLTGAFTNGWYTTIDRDPFAWSYDPDGDLTNDLNDYVGSWLENPALGALVSGPRWRLKPNKYGQDLPGLEIAIEAPPGGGTDGADCYAPPFTKELIKYPVGDPTITEINLLDWEDATTSPMAYSTGWIDVTQNGFVTVDGTNSGVPYTTNGLPMTDDFDLAVYVKGDRKATAVYDAQLVIDYAVAPTVLVPNIVGQLVTVAEETLAPDLLLAVTGSACSDVYPVVDTVITQDPAADATAYVGDTVNVTLSTGACEPGVVVVPSIGECPTVAVATGIINTAGLTVNPVNLSEPSAVCPVDTVIRTVPPAGTEVAAGSEVQLVVSTGPVADLSDVSITSVQIPANLARSGIVKTLFVTITNAATAAGSGTGTVTLSGTDGSAFTNTFTNLVPGASLTSSWNWTVPSSQTVIWTIEVTVNGVVVDSVTRQTAIR